MDHNGDAQDDHHSKRGKMDFCPSAEEERLAEEEEPKMSQLEQSPASVSQARSDVLGPSENLPDHMKVNWNSLQLNWFSLSQVLHNLTVKSS